MVDLETILWVLWQFKFNVKKEAKKQQQKKPPNTSSVRTKCRCQNSNICRLNYFQTG